MSNEEALIAIIQMKDMCISNMTEMQCRLWWLAKSTLRDSLGNGQIKREQIPEGVEI